MRDFALPVMQLLLEHTVSLLQRNSIEHNILSHHDPFVRKYGESQLETSSWCYSTPFSVWASHFGGCASKSSVHAGLFNQERCVQNNWRLISGNRRTATTEPINAHMISLTLDFLHWKMIKSHCSPTLHASQLGRSHHMIHRETSLLVRLPTFLHTFGT